MSDERRFCTFYLDGHFFGVEVEEVQEVLRFHEMTRVPLADPVVEGLINLRGQIVTALDLRTKLGLERRPSEKSPMNVVIRTEDDTLSLLVDEIGDVIETDPMAFEAPPETLNGTARELIRGAYKLEGRLLLVLDIEKVIGGRPSLVSASAD